MLVLLDLLKGDAAKFGELRLGQFKPPPALSDPLSDGPVHLLMRH